jgi:CTP:molybdopterin cytidylyltransferase MocA
MRSPKQLLRWGDETLLSRAAKTALKTTCRPVIVVLGCEADTCRQALEQLPVTAVINKEWRRGMGTSVSAGIAALETAEPAIGGALLTLVDQPGVTQALLESLISRWGPPDTGIVATSYGARGGVPALFDRRYFPDLRQLDSDRGARDLIAREIDQTILVAPSDVLLDLDTPDDYRVASPV